MKRISALAATVVAALLVACGGPVSPTPPAEEEPTRSPRASSTPMPASPSASAPPSEAPAVEWQAANVPATDDGTATVQVVPGGEGLIAIGFDGGFGSILWTSADDGRTWTDVTPPGFESIGLATVIEHDGRLIGVGRGNTIDIETEEAAVYLSDDGLAWTKVETTDPLIGQMIDVVATDDGLFAVGGVPGADSAGVWRSTDGETWERIGSDLEHAFLWSIAEGGPGLVAVGWRRNPEPDLAVWTSADAGATWELAPDPEGLEGFEATDVVGGADGTLVMVGSSLGGDGGRIWTSTDGVAWTLVLDDMDGAYARSVIAVEDGFVAVGGGADAAARAWWSADGASWNPLGEPIRGAYFSNVLAVDEGWIASGATQSGTLESGIRSAAGVWVASAD
jgi:hypothetical protein